MPVFNKYLVKKYFKSGFKGMKPGIKSVDSKLNGTNWKININFRLKGILCLNLLKL